MRRLPGARAGFRARFRAGFHLVFLAVAEQPQRAAAHAAQAGGVDQRVLAAMGYPDLRRADLVDGGVQRVPVGVVGDHQRQFHPARLGPLAHRHPAGGHRHHRIGQPVGPAIGDGAGRGEHQRALQLGLGGGGGGQQFAELHALLLIDLAHPAQRAVQENRSLPAGLAQQRDHPLAFAERIAADDMGPVGEQFPAGEQPGDFLVGRRMVEHRQARTSPR